MDKASALLLLIPILLLLECGSKKETSQKEDSSSANETTAVMNSDTIPQAPPPPPPALAPGHAKVRAEITGQDFDTKGTLSLKVKEVLGYGPATPPIAVNDTLAVRYTTQGQDKINIGKIVSAVISYRQQLDSSKSSPLWTFVSFEEDPN